jgi:asparagine synthase (glutamine-hydrolysing)
MCGILATNHPGTDPERFGRALDLMAFRGPDAWGTGEVAGWRLGHRRLKIIDLDDRSNQPFTTACGRFTVIYNGEIYNFRDLARRHRIETRTTGDTEVLVELFAKLGPAMLGELNGMFAFAVIDRRSGRLFAARDRLGIKPLYWHRSADGHLSVASEVAALLELVGTPPFDEIGLRQYAKLRAFFNGRTAYCGIEMLPAGHFLDDGVVRRYWSLPGGAQHPPSDEELRALVEAAVKRRCLADVPVGSYLSGGLDSTIVAGLAGEPHTWTVGFEGYNEFEWGRLAAERFGSVHHEVLVSRDEFLDVARRMIAVRREPLSVPNEVLLYKMTAAVKEYNTVVLSGEGADELFFGYDRVFRWAAAAPGWDLQRFSELYSYGLHDDPEIVEEAVGPSLAAGDTPLDAVAHFFQTAHLHGLLRRVDFATMLPSVEARVPFVDHTLVERMAGVPFGYRMAGGVVKAPLKRAFADLVPAPIIDRQKVGFPVPLEEIFAEGVTAAGGPRKESIGRWLQFNLEALTGAEVELADLGIPAAAPGVMRVEEVG